MKNLQEKIKQYLVLQSELRSELGKSNQYYNLPFAEMSAVARLMSNQQRGRFIEGWMAHQIGGKKLDSRQVPIEMKGNRDYGDLQVDEELVIGKNNIELKASFNLSKTGVGGQQLRMWEPVAYYMFFKTKSDTEYDLFLLSKDELIFEMKNKVKVTGRSAFTSSHGTGKFEGLTNEDKLSILDENIKNTRQDLIGWGFNTKTETEYYKYFKSKYSVKPEEVKAKINETV